MSRKLRKVAYGLLSLVGFLAGMYCLYLYEANPAHTGLLSDLVKVALSHPLAAGVTLDALIAGVAFLIWLVPEARSLSMRHWWVYIALFFTAPLAFVVPFFLLMREAKLDA